MKQDESDIEQFYNESIKTEGMPEFESLSDEKRRRLRGSALFAAWNMGKAVHEFGMAVETAVRNLIDNMK